MSLAKPRDCDLDFFATETYEFNNPVIPDSGHYMYEHKEERKGEILTLEINPIYAHRDHILMLFGVYYKHAHDLPSDTSSFCEFTISIDSLEVQVIKEGALYLGRMDPIETEATTLREYMSIFELSNLELNQTMTVDLKPCSNTFIEFCVS